jgi:hypothetical protein
MAEYYARRFGRGRIGIFPLEQLAQHPEEYAQRMAEFLGVEPARTLALLGRSVENRRKTRREIGYVALRSYLPVGSLSQAMPPWLRARFAQFLAGGQPASVPLPQRWRDAISEMHGEGNRRLAADYCLDLERYGYPVARC